MNVAFVLTFWYLFQASPNSVVVCDPTECVALPSQYYMIADRSDRLSKMSKNGINRALTIYNPREEQVSSVDQCVERQMQLVKKADQSGVVARYQALLNKSRVSQRPARRHN